jgi:hypothetical protein
VPAARDRAKVEGEVRLLTGILAASPKERPRLRQRSLDWLRADLEAKRLLWEKDANQAGADLRKQMQHWLLDPDFAGVRGPEHLAKLPEAERQAWQKLWKDVADMLKQAQEKAAPQKR